MKVSAVVFDLDHTLFDRYATLALTAPMFREKFGFKAGVTDEYFTEQLSWADKQFVYNGWEGILSHLIACDVFANAPTFNEYKEFLLSCFTRVAVKYDFSIPVLEELRKSGVKIGLITNGRHNVQMSKLKMLSLTDCFDEIIISGDTPFEKPQKEIFLLAAERLGVLPSEMMYVGDHPKFDVDGSRNAGCVPIWVKTTGTWSFPEIEKPGLQVETVAEIPEIVKILNGDNKMILDELTKFSNFYGSNPELVLAGGGNTSAKTENTMYIKGSGTSLATIMPEKFVEMDREKLSLIFTKKYPDDDKEREALSLADLNAAKLPNQESKRPSVETTLHSLFEQKFVLHLHPWLVNALTCAENGMSECERLFGDSVLWIEPCKPGYTLAKLCYDKMADYKARTGRSADIILLANHGIFVADDDSNKLGDKLYFVMDKIRDCLESEADLDTGDYDGDAATQAFNACGEIYGDDTVVTYCPSVASLELSKEGTVGEITMPFNPDQIVYCKPYPVFARSAAEILPLYAEYEKKNGFLPKIVLVENVGLFAVDKTQKGSETASLLFEDAIKIAVGTRSFGGARPMSSELTDFIVNWEAESYRSKQ